MTNDNFFCHLKKVSKLLFSEDRSEESEEIISFGLNNIPSDWDYNFIQDLQLKSTMM